MYQSYCKDRGTQEGVNIAEQQLSKQVEKTNGEDKDKPKIEKKTAVELFAERVTMAGVEDTYKAKFLPDRWMWYVAMLAAFAGTIMTARSVAQKYVYPRVIHDYFPIVNFRPPFPNVSVCAPFTWNRTKFLHDLVVPNRTLNLIRRKRLNFDRVLDFAEEFWRYDLYPRIVEKKDLILQKAAFEIIKATVARFINGYSALITGLQPSCDEVLSDCSFVGVPFDCCQAAQRVYVWDTMCFQIDVNQIPMFKNTEITKGGEADDPIKLETSGLVVNVSFDWEMASYFEETVKDGFQLVVGRIVSSMANPVSVPSGADALVTLGATKREDLSDCRSNNNLPKLKYFDGYDPDGVFLYNEVINIQRTIDQIGCDSPVLTHEFVAEQSVVPVCPIEMLAFLKTYSNNGDYDREMSKGTVVESSAINRQEVDVFHASLPLCNRWEYKIVLASYGYVHNRNQIEWDRPREDAGKTWSRLRIYFPNSAYLRRVEQPPNQAYAAMRDVSGAMMVYIGVSLVSFIQVVVYGSYVLYSYASKYANRNRVSPLTLEVTAPKAPVISVVKAASVTCSHVHMKQDSVKL